ncbi:MAG: hypothetical protein ACLFVU_06845 [Phycisphaerae bacterium]
MNHLKNAFLVLPAAWLVLTMSGAASAEKASVERTDQVVKLALGNGTVLEFALDGDLLLGLNQVTVDGTQLTSGDTVQRPILAQEWEEDRIAWPFMKLADVKALDDGSVEVTATLLGTGSEDAYRGLFVYGPNFEAALGKRMTPELKKLKEAADAAEGKIEKALMADVKYKEHVDEVAKRKAAYEKTKRESDSWYLNQAKTKLQNYARKVRGKYVEESASLQKADETIARYRKALNERAMEIGKIHRDYYRFAHTRLPSTICSINWLKEHYSQIKPSLKPGGTVTWVIAPENRNIAGWEWKGFKRHYRFDLPEGKKVNKLRQLGTWELDGQAAGNTLVNLRYRGLGRIQQKLSDAGDGSVEEAWSTTEIMPGAVGGAPMISPVVPVSKDVNDRGYALKHRAGAWICHMARGAGHGFVDYQFTPKAALASFYVRQGGLRALGEVMPGDKVVSQTDDEYFKLTGKGRTTDQVYVVLNTKDQPLKIEESRTRWREVDQHVRDLLSEELGFVQYEPLPGIGILSDAGWAGYYKSLANGGVQGWAEKNVKFVAYHNPGWVNGRYQGPDGPPKMGGGVCNIYDWWPTKDVVEPWTQFQKAASKEKVAFYIWLGQTVWKDAPFVRRVGFDKKHWSLNGPNDEFAPGYGAVNMKGNIYDEKFRNEFIGQLNRLHEQCGYQGFWVDSFQNLFMSQLNWANGTGESMQRGWWEQAAKWSRNGVAWMAESHGFPGMSCSIEVQDWEKDVEYFQHVWKWLRGNEQSHYSPEQLDVLTFRTMSNKGWIAPDMSYKTHANFRTKSFERLAGEYYTALPDMRRPYELPDGKGMLWLPYDGNGEGVWFSWDDQNVPAGVKCSYILDENGKKAGEVKKHHTYRVSAGDLLKAFGVRTGGEDDPRIGRKYEMPDYAWPVK